MAKVKWAISDDDPEFVPSFDVYDGPEPPAGVYRFRLRRLGIRKNSNNDDMLNGLLVISDSRPDKKKYNGWTVWFNQNVTDQGKPYLVQFLASIGVTLSDFVNKSAHDGATVTERPVQITRIASVKMESEPMLRASLGMSKPTEKYPIAKMEAKQFLPLEEETDADDKDGDDEDPFA